MVHTQESEERLSSLPKILGVMALVLAFGSAVALSVAIVENFEEDVDWEKVRAGFAAAAGGALGAGMLGAFARFFSKH